MRLYSDFTETTGAHPLGLGAGEGRAMRGRRKGDEGEKGGG